MKETFYFPHDYNATQDPKMMNLLVECGLPGLALYWIIIEILHQQPEGKITKEAYSGYIELYGRKDGENEQVLNKCQQMLITTNLLVEQDGFITSKRVLENKKQRQIISEKRSLAGKISAEIRAKATSVEHVSTSVEQGKERKGKEKKDNNIYMSASADEPFTSFWKAYPRKELKKKTLAIWKRKKLDPKLEQILAFIEKAKNTDRWQKGFIKQPPAFLNGECWDDDLSAYGDYRQEPKTVIFKRNKCHN